MFRLQGFLFWVWRLDRLEFRAAQVEPGDYLARVEVNRVVSLLSVDEDPESPDYGRYNGPKVSIP